jgi:hypothetical protein
LRRLWWWRGVGGVLWVSPPLCFGRCLWLCFVARGGAVGGGVCVVGLWVLARLSGLGGVVVLCMAVGACGSKGFKGGPA